MAFFIHAANLVFLISYVVRDILKLRILTVAGGCLLLAYFLTSAIVVWPAVGWNVLFSLINAFQIALLIAERRPVRLSAEEHRLHRLAFRSLTPREFVKLLKIVGWQDATPGQRLVESGSDPGRLIIILDGRVEVKVGDSRVATLGAVPDEGSSESRRLRAGAFACGEHRLVFSQAAPV